MRATIFPYAIILTKVHIHGQYNGQGAYCGLSTASEVFLIFTTQLYQYFSCFLIALCMSIKYSFLNTPNLKYSLLLTSGG